jgi:hypothetical protein
LILILGVWGGLIPFVGPYFHFVLGPTKSWTWTTDRLYLDVLPGIVAVLGGALLIGAGPRASGRLGALLALAAGIWFATGPEVSLLWNAAGAQGAAHGSRDIRMLEMLTFHSGLGVVIAALAGYALPRPGAREVVAEPGPAAASAVADRDLSRRPGQLAADEPAYADEHATTRGESIAAGGPSAARDREYAGESPTAVREGEAEPESPTAVGDGEHRDETGVTERAETPAGNAPAPEGERPALR